MQNAKRNLSGIFRNPSGIFVEPLRNLCGIFVESWGNPYEIYLCIVHAWFYAASRFYANFTQILRRVPRKMRCRSFAKSFWNPCGITQTSMENATQNLGGIFRNPSGIFVETLRNLCKIFAEPMRNLSMPYPCLILCDMQISRKFHSDFTQSSKENAMQSFHKIFLESLRNLCGIFAESMRNLSTPYPCLISCSMQVWRKFYADFTQTSKQNAMPNLCGISAETLRSLCGIHAKSIHALSMLYSMQHEDFTQISRRFDADFHAECHAESLRNFFRNFSGIFAESMRNLSLTYPCLLLCKMHFFQVLGRNATRNLGGIFRNPSGIFVETLRNLCGIFAESWGNPY